MNTPSCPGVHVQRAHIAALQHAERTTPTDPVAHHATGAVNTHPAPPRTLPAEHPAGGPGEHPVNGAGERGQPHPVNRPARDPGRVPRGAGDHRRAPRTARSGAHKGRKLLADYVAQARLAWTPGVVVTPAWVRV